MIALFKKEIWMNWKTPWGYLKCAGFLMLAGFFFVSFLNSYNDRVAQYLASQMVVGSGTLGIRAWIIQPYFEALIFFLLFLAPLSSMGSLAEEFRQGTFFRIGMSPLSSTVIIVAKFLSCFIELCVWGLLGSIPVFVLCLMTGESLVSCALGIGTFLLVGSGFVVWGITLSGFVRHSAGAVMVSVITLVLLYFSHSFLPGESSSLLAWISPAKQSSALLSGFIQATHVGYFLALLSGTFVSALFFLHRERRA